MSKVKLNSVLFEYMEKITEKKYNYNFFLNELFSTIDYFEESHYITLDEKELEPFFRNSKKEETIEKLLKAFMFGYEEESDTYTIVLFERDDFEFVLWEVDCKYEVSIKEKYHEDEVFRKSFTRAEILNKFPELWPLAQKNK
ncbi:hypothetical protein SG586P1_00040 [Streptococcus phage SG586P1]|nr:hypothetical protein SG586P1_00040 [Streptococcus phage SG586P1]WAX18053.1 hypothetical protein SG586P3_00048 [Streptococcus phage SG586P3]